MLRERATDFGLQQQECLAAQAFCLVLLSGLDVDSGCCKKSSSLWQEGF